MLATEEMPFDKFADDPRFIFSRDGDEWVQQCRDPRIQPSPLEGGLEGLHCAHRATLILLNDPSKLACFFFTG